MPAVIAGVAILGVAAFLIFGSSASSETATEAAGKGASQANSDRSVAGDPSRKVRGGVSQREIDEAKGRVEPRRNPALGPMIEGRGMKMVPDEPPPPPSFANKAEEITYYQGKLEVEQAMLEKRAEFLARSNKNINKAETPEQKEVAEGRTKMVQKNYDEQKDKVESLERKLAELRE